MINVQQYQQLDPLNNYLTTTEQEVVCGGLDFKKMFYSNQAIIKLNEKIEIKLNKPKKQHDYDYYYYI
jgi:hypothetical protein